MIERSRSWKILQDCSKNNWQIKSVCEEDTNQVRATLQVAVKSLQLVVCYSSSPRKILLKSQIVSGMIFTACCCSPENLTAGHSCCLWQLSSGCRQGAGVVLGEGCPLGSNLEPGYDVCARALARPYWPLLGHLHPARAHTTRIITTPAWTPRWPPGHPWPPWPPRPPLPPLPP